MLGKKDIEELATSAVKCYFNLSNSVSPRISENDKTPDWDGVLSLYKGVKDERKNYVGDLKIQIKGREVTEFKEKETYPVETVFLRNSLNEGFVFFVVEVKTDGTNKIFYKMMAPIEIRGELELISKKEKKSKRQNQRNIDRKSTQIADIDYGKIQLYAGNYDFWYESSQLLIRQMKEANKKKEEKIKELQDFISRFSANASKSKQATSRKRALEKIELDEIKPSSRKYPYIDFRPNRDIGNEVLTVEGLSKTIDGVKILDNLTFTLNHDDKVAFVGGNELAKTVLFKILIGEMEPDEGTYKWGITTSQAYFPKDFGGEFDNDYTITEWLTQYSENKDATYVRGFLGRMLFSGEDGVKRLKVLSGGEKVRCLLSKMMISGANVLLLDEPTNHLDMESITALNNGMIKFPGVLLFTSRDHQIVQTTANRIMEIVPGGKLIDKITTYDEYLESDEMARKRQTYTVETEEED